MNKNQIIYLLGQNNASSEVLKAYISEIGYNELEFFDDYNKALSEIVQKDFEPIVIIDIDEKEDTLSFIKAVRNTTSKLIVLASDYSTDSMVKFLRLGIVDFLQKPILKNKLEQAIIKCNEKKGSIEQDSSRIITIYSNKGGIGKTTIATNLALELTKITRSKVALIDLNLQLGDISTFLNLSPSFDVAYVIKNLIDKKEEVLLNAFEKYKETDLYILSDPAYIEHAEAITSQQIDSLFKKLKKIFSYIIVDVSSSIDANSLKILDKSDYILFTSIVNIPAIRNAQRCLNLFKSRRYDKNKVKIIINRYIENDEITSYDIETALGEKIFWKIPNNFFTIMESINKGLFVSEVNSSSNIANSFKDLAIKISDEIVKEAISSN